MRKPFIPALAMALVLTACAAQPDDTVPMTSLTDPPPSVSGHTALNAPPPENLDYVLDMSVYENASTLEDGVRLAHCRYEVPVLRVEKDGVEVETAASPFEKLALTAAETFNEGFAAWNEGQDFPEHAEMAREDYQVRPEYFTGGGFYEDLLTCTVYQTPTLISVQGTYRSYTGGAHENTSLLSWNFDLGTGAFFAAADLSDDPLRFVQAVTGEIIRQAGVRAAENSLDSEEMYWPDYRDIAAQWTSYPAYFSAGGMTVCFSPYELAAYAAGPQYFTMDFTFLEPYLNDYGRGLLVTEPEE